MKRIPALADLARSLEYPVFVKPNALGSSVGISKVKSESALGAALEDAFAYDRKVLIEAACVGRELECAVLGNQHPESSIPGEIIVRGRHEFYSYESKYIDPAGAEVKIPAALTAVAERASARARVRRVSRAGAARDGAGRFSGPPRRSAKSTSTRSTRFPALLR